MKIKSFEYFNRCVNAIIALCQLTLRYPYDEKCAGFDR